MESGTAARPQVPVPVYPTIWTAEGVIQAYGLRVITHIQRGCDCSNCHFVRVADAAAVSPDCPTVEWMLRMAWEHPRYNWAFPVFVAISPQRIAQITVYVQCASADTQYATPCRCRPLCWDPMPFHTRPPPPPPPPFSNWPVPLIQHGAPLPSPPETPSPPPSSASRKAPVIPSPAPRKQPVIPSPAPRKQPVIPSPAPRKQPVIPSRAPKKQPPRQGPQKQPRWERQCEYCRDFVRAPHRSNSRSHYRTRCSAFRLSERICIKSPVEHVAGAMELISSTNVRGKARVAPEAPEVASKTNMVVAAQLLHGTKIPDSCDRSKW